MGVPDPIWTGLGLTPERAETVRADVEEQTESVEAVRFEMKIWADGQASDADGNPLDHEGSLITKPLSQRIMDVNDARDGRYIEQPEQSEQES